MADLATELDVKEKILWSGHARRGLALGAVQILFFPLGIPLAIADAWRRARTEYVVTEDRVLIGVMGPEIDLTVLPYVGTPNPVLKTHRRGGTILFMRERVEPGEPRIVRLELGFEAGHVYRVITEAQAQAIARWPLAFRQNG